MSRRLIFTREGQKERFYFPFDFDNCNGADKDSFLVVGFADKDQKLIGAVFLEQEGVGNITIEDTWKRKK